VSGFGEVRQRGTARVAQTEQLRRLVECFARRIVLRVAEKPIAADTGYFEELAVSAGDEECDEGKRRLRGGKQRRKEMAFQVMNADHGLP